MEIRSQYPRYIRDQLQMILRQIQRTRQQAMIDQALTSCVKKKLFCATDFIDMVQYIERQRSFNRTGFPAERVSSLKPLDIQNESIFHTTTPKCDVDEYLTVLEGRK